jgi:type I restriction enzyme R subunit
MTFNEDSRVKIPALIHLSKLGYEFKPLGSFKKDPETNIALDIFEESLIRINPTHSVDEIEIYKKQVISSLANDDLGKVFYDHLVNQSGIKLIDFDNFENNQLNCVTEYDCENGLESFRPDITILVNGLPLAFIEVKKPNNPEGIRAERDRINTRFANRNFKKFINLTQFMIFSNNMEYDLNENNLLQGAFYSTTSFEKASFNFFREQIYDLKAPKFKGDSDEDLILKSTNLISIKHTPEFKTNKEVDTPTNRILTSMFTPERLQFILRYGIAYVDGYQGLEKHIMRYPQIFGSYNLLKKLESNVKDGIFWHTQGSGKTALAYFNTRLLTDYFQKKNVIGKFYFVVDRLDLLRQAKSEFIQRGLKVNTINSKSEFINEFTKNEAIKTTTGKLEITVINIQKFSNDANELFKNDYSLDIQRVFFIDEAHRSYKENGSFFANLKSADRNGIHICLTGTPLIGEYATKKIFGDYIHKYFYNDSIRDGYTLRLIREEIEASYSTKIKEVLDKLNLEVEKGALPRNLVLSHKSFVNPMMDYIANDLTNSRVIHGDQSIGGMIVCDSSDQARALKASFDSNLNSKGLSTALILFDEGDKDDRERLTEDYKAGKIDILIVYNMLITGFNVPRLKKLYLARVVREHNLLQTLTRVNRPYNKLKYGYIVDFADISAEFDKTNAAYYKELQDELGEDYGNYSNIFLNPKEIENTIHEIKTKLFSYDLTNAEIFSSQISKITDKKTIREIVSCLTNAQEISNLIKAYGHDELAGKMDFKKLSTLLIEARNRLDLILLNDRIQVSDETKALLNTALENVVFSFSKTGEAELEIGNKVKEVTRLVRETLARNIDEKDPEYISLYEQFINILKNRNIQEGVSLDLENNVKDLEIILNKARGLNEKNSLLVTKYKNDPKYARIHKNLKVEAPKLGDVEIYELLTEIQSHLFNLIDNNENILENRGYFEAEISKLLADISANDLDYVQLINMDKLELEIAHEYFMELERSVA